MPVPSKVKMSEVKKKSEQEHNQQIFFRNTYNIFSIKRVTRKFNVTTTTAKKCTKECATR